MNSYFVRIRLPALPVFMCLLMIWSGCSSVSVPNLHERNYRESRTYTHEANEVFAATRGVLEAMGFEITSASPGKGDLTAASRVLAGSAAELRRQRRAIASIKWNSEAMSEVKIGFWESTEEQTPNESVVSSEKLLRGGPLYDSFWVRMNGALPMELPPTPAGKGSASG